MTIPTFEALRLGGICTIYCPKCCRDHTHSLPEALDTPEHRVAHCLDRANYPSGYNIFIRSAMLGTNKG
jgi:hypothetical protein